MLAGYWARTELATTGVGLPALDLEIPGEFFFWGGVEPGEGRVYGGKGLQQDTKP